MNELSKTRTVETVGAEIRNLTGAAKYMSLFYATEIGKRLEEAKAMVGHGEWLSFLERETEFSSSAANRFMRVYKEYGNPTNSNFPTLGNISVSNALRLLAVPEEERETFAQEVDAAHISSRELEEAIRARADAERKIAELESDLTLEKNNNANAAQTIQGLMEKQDAARDKLVEAEKRIKELESRPVEVAVQEPSEADIAAAVEKATVDLQRRQAAELKALNEEGEKAKAKMQKLEEALKEAKKKAKEASEGDNAQRAAMEKEIVELRKSIAMSSKEMVIFKLKFESWQTLYAEMQALIGSMGAETAEKCRLAMGKAMEGWK